MANIGPGGLRAQCVAWPLLLPSFSLSLSPLSSFFSSLSLAFDPLRETPVCEIPHGRLGHLQSLEYLSNKIFKTKTKDYLATSRYYSYNLAIL